MLNRETFNGNQILRCYDNFLVFNICKSIYVKIRNIETRKFFGYFSAGGNFCLKFFQNWKRKPTDITFESDEKIEQS
jgi:hypothetical protein